MTSIIIIITNSKFILMRTRTRFRGIMNFINKTSRPDLDNLSKFTLDLLNGVFIEDDAQVVLLNLAKAYYEHPRTEVDIIPMLEVGAFEPPY